MYTKSNNLLTFLKKADASQIYVFKNHLDSLISVTKALGSIDRLDELLDTIIHYALTVTGAARGFLFLYGKNNGDLQLEVMRGISEELLKEDYSFETYGVSQEIIGIVKETRRALIVSQEDGSIVQGSRDINLYGVKQALCVPFQSHGKLLGFLYLDHSFDKELFRDQELRLIESFTTLTSVSIENAFLTSKLEKCEDKNISITIKPISSAPDLTIIAIKGFLNSVAIKNVDEKILPFIEHKATDVIIDLTNLDYTNKIGIMCLMKYLALITNKKKMLKFVKPPQHVYKTLETVGIAKKIDMYDNIEAAIGSA
jgi:anti-anti-sigma factor